MHRHWSLSHSPEHIPNATYKIPPFVSFIFASFLYCVFVFKQCFWCAPCEHINSEQKKCIGQFEQYYCCIWLFLLRIRYAKHTESNQEKKHFSLFVSFVQIVRIFVRLCGYQLNNKGIEKKIYFGQKNFANSDFQIKFEFYWK